METLKKPKYKNKRIVIDGISFDSIKESVRYGELMILFRQGEIKDLRLQPSFRISKGETVDPVTGRQKSARKYIADFSYINVVTGENVVEDVKSVVTAKQGTYRLKRQLFLELYGDQCIFREI